MQSDNSLKQDSPGLYRRLSNLLAKPDIDRVSSTYTLAMSYNTREEPSLNRSPGASFNPRPARIVEIIMRECEEKDPTVLCAAMLACANAEGLNNLCSGSAEAALARQARSFPAPCNKAAERIALALKLDELRHLHMRNLSSAQIGAILDDVRDRHLPAIRHHAEHERLKTLLESALLRFSR